MIQKPKDQRPFVALLSSEMRSEDSHRRDEVLQTMLRIGSPEAIKSALGAAAASENGQVRQWAPAHLERLDLLQSLSSVQANQP